MNKNYRYKTHNLFCCLVFLLFIMLDTYAQNMGKIWYFGEYAGVDFNGSEPTALTDGVLSSVEGCATMSDVDGNLLFYTNSVKVWNKEHQQMTNGFGLNGHHSSTQAACIVKKPGNNTIFYVFTLDNFTNSDGLQYSTIDMSLDEGNGDVVDKNIPLLTPVSEKLTTVLHSNGIDIWVITHKWNSDKFYSYLVTEDGLDDPIITSCGTTHSGGTYGYYNCIGYMRPSNDGAKLALAIYEMGIFEIFDFDNTTGIVSNSIILDGFTKSYSVEFSPDDTKLYAKFLYSGTIYQFDLTEETEEDIADSKTLIGTATAPASSPNYISGALQLGPDGKIYVTKYGSGYLGVINEPDEVGLDCDYDDDGLYLNGKEGQLGLPHTGNVDHPIIFSDKFCFGDSTQFNIIGIDETAIDSVFWNFGDPVSGEFNFSDTISTFHLFSSSGIFIVSVDIYIGTITMNLEEEIIIFPKANIFIGNDTVICGNQSIQLETGNEYENYYWSTGSNESSILIDTSGVYWVEAINEFGCSDSDSILIEIYPNPEVNLGNDTSICANDSLLLSVGNNYLSFLWNDSSVSSTMLVDTSGYFWLEVSNEFGCTDRDSIYVEFYPLAYESLNLGQDTVLCYGESITISGGSGYELYLWQDGSTDSTYYINTSGTYWVEVENPCSYGNDTIVVEILPQIIVSLGNDTVICFNETLLLDAGFGYNSYLWQDGSSNQYLYAIEEGWYSVEVGDGNQCTEQDTVYVGISNPNANIGSDTTICSGDSITLIASEGFVSYLWQNGDSVNNITVNEQGVFWCNVIDSIGCIKTDSILIELQQYPEVDLGIDTGFCIGDTLLININSLNELDDIIWYNGETDSDVLIYEEGIYWITISNICGTLSDSIFISEYHSPSFTLGNDTLIVANSEIILDPGPGFSQYLWSNGSTSQTLTISEAGSYWVNLSNGQCYSSDTINIEPIDCYLFIPIVFTPNGDGSNDFFYAKTSSNITNFDLRVFNRWGEQVWETNDQYDMWNGNRNMNNAADGTYFWILLYDCLGTLTQIEKKGSVTLLR